LRLQGLRRYARVRSFESIVVFSYGLTRVLFAGYSQEFARLLTVLLCAALEDDEVSDNGLPTQRPKGFPPGFYNVCVEQLAKQPFV
jgi:hypothetical protein